MGAALVIEHGSMNSIRFIHCGDIHLGAGRQIHPERYEDFFRVFDEVISAAIDEEVDVLLITGDLFDSKEPDVETMAKAAQLLQRARSERPEMTILAIEGNHDMRKRARGAFQNEQGVLDVFHQAGLLQLLRPGFDADGSVYFELGVGVVHVPGTDLSIAGFGYAREDAGQKFREAAQKLAEQFPRRRLILMAHMMLVQHLFDGLHGAARPDDILPLPENIIYVALGHGHGRVDTHHPLHFEKFWSPGSLEFVHARNTSKPEETRGYFLARLEPGFAEVRHKSTRSKRPFLHRSFELSAGAAPNMEQVLSWVGSTFETALDARSNEHDLAPILSVELTGRLGFPVTEFRSSLIQVMLRDRFKALQVFVRRQDLDLMDGTTAELDPFSGDDYGDAIRQVLVELVEASAVQLGLGSISSTDRALVQSLERALLNPSEAKESFGFCLEHLTARRGRPSAPLAVTWPVVDLQDPSVLEQRIKALEDQILKETVVPVVVYLTDVTADAHEDLQNLLNVEDLQERLESIEGISWVTIRVNSKSLQVSAAPIQEVGQ